jgi:Fe-S cluster assembly iron-binding protein IscA
VASITQSAAAWLRKRYGSAIDLLLVPGGCAGYLYKWSEHSDSDAQLLIAYDIAIYTNTESYKYVCDVEISLKANLIGNAIVIKNPVARGCGCNKSIPIYTNTESYKYDCDAEISLKANLIGNAIAIKNPVARGCGCQQIDTTLGVSGSL